MSYDRSEKREGREARRVIETHSLSKSYGSHRESTGSTLGGARRDPADEQQRARGRPSSKFDAFLAVLATIRSTDQRLGKTAAGGHGVLGCRGGARGLLTRLRRL
ncbi:MAG TPA: hypothetical protein VJ375_17655 [Gaiellaceae bacterium]|nr:hypothetical protein [Gaiellaceae bacterium]